MDEEKVELVIGGAKGDKSPLLFQCCHIGMVFFSPDPIEDYKQMDFNLSLMAEDGSGIPLNCKGVVVDSDYEEERGMYKTFMLYTEIDDKTKQKLKKISQEKELRCPFCLKS